MTTLATTVPPPSVPIAKGETTAALSGLITGLITIFLPLLQALPNHVPQSTVIAAVIAGISLVATSVTGWLAQRYGAVKTAATLHAQQLHDASVFADNSLSRSLHAAITAAPDEVKKLRTDFDQIIPSVVQATKEIVPDLQNQVTQVRDLVNRISQAQGIKVTEEEIEPIVRKILAELANKPAA